MENLLKDIVEQAKQNPNFRKVLLTGPKTQVVIMSLMPGEEIGEEVHPNIDQVLYFVEGSGEAIIEGERAFMEQGDLILVPAGTKHNFVNSGDKDLKILTFYSPPEHPAGTIHKTKQEAEDSHH
ncbi:MAG: cupin [Candidatus Woykebacteria bacterium RBG_13_40_7b]|uniref:Cupin n=1 Tax=Candidatus Woykebacteria bacterium RBG_13_40_7b TaxID=1802594 RepID=A0A1G1WCZ1_9BACT|nr:MAG: cupin [Candidatus Woykebacteria bacterium RBG_13_40_7b]